MKIHEKVWTLTLIMGVTIFQSYIPLNVNCLFTNCLFTMRSALPREGGGRQVETEGQTGLDTDQQVPALP